MEGYSSAQLIENGISQIFAGDKRRLDEVLGGQGWRYIAGAICIFPLTIIKVIDFLFRNKHLYHTPKITPMEEMSGVGLSSIKLKDCARLVYFREQIESHNDNIAPLTPEKKTTKQEQKLNAVQSLQSMFNSNVELKGTIIKLTHHRVSSEKLLESAESGELKDKFITQRVTFGNDTNALLKTAFPLLKLRNLKNSSDTYFVFENDEIFELEMKLRNTFMVPVTIMLKKVKNEK
jgi:hypothetical protein